MKIAKLLLFVIVLGLASGHDATVKAQDLSAFFKDTEGTVVLYDLKNNRYVRHNEARSRRRFTPYSTFKIPNSLIGLETGVIKDASFVIPWDRQKYPPQDSWNVNWKGDQTLRSAIKYSAVWYYKELAQRVGGEAMKGYVTRFQYGNEDTSGGIDRFWLGSSLQISADEQVRFLQRFYKGELPISKRSTDIVKDILVLEETPAYKLSGKTGGGPAGNGKTLGWFVGYVEHAGNVCFFALNIDGPSFAAIRDKRIQMTKQILIDLGYLPKQ